MTRARHIQTVLLVGWVGFASAGWICLAAQSVPPEAGRTPPVPTGIAHHNPFQTFRELLAATAAERESILSRKPEVHRKHLEERLKEFGDMPVPEREVRLRMMELRWYLVPLLRIPASNRVDHLASVPDGTRKLVEDRLKEWDALPADLRREVLQHGVTLQYFARPEAVSPREQVKLWNSMQRDSKPQPSMNADQWGSLVAERKRGVSIQLERFFELSAEEKEKTLRAFSDNERKQVDSTLKKFEQLSALQRKQCLDSFQQYAEMSENARNEFLRSAARWKAMSAEERKVWRSLVTKLPPMPPGLESATLPPHPGGLEAADANR